MAMQLGSGWEHVLSIWQHALLVWLVCRKYSKFSYVLCRCFLMRMRPTKHYTKIYHGDNTKCSIWTNCPLLASQYPQCNLAAFFIPLALRFTLLILYDNCLWSASTTNNSGRLNWKLFLLGLRVQTTALYESKYRNTKRWMDLKFRGHKNLLNKAIASWQS